MSRFIVIAVFAWICFTHGQPNDQNGFSTALSTVTLQLEKSLRKDGENLFISPLGLVTAMGMLHLGAKNSSARQIYEGLSFNEFANSPAEVAQNLQVNIDLYQKTSPAENYTLNLANQLFIQNGFGIEDQFRQDMETYYSAQVQQVDFINSPLQASHTINSWVSNNTGGMIQKLFDPTSISPLWRLVLTNAIYFRGFWQNTFDTAKTKLEDFAKLDGSIVKVPLMSQQNTVFAYRQLPHIKSKVLQMPYTGKDIKMTVVLPDDPKGLYEVLALLTAENLQEVFGDLPTEEVNVKFPKFRFESEYDESLMWALRTKLGINDIFDESKANLSGISSDFLYVQLIKQKGVVEVDEKGTKAAVVTGLGIATKLGGIFKPTPQFIANHPFIFIITDTRNGAILFFGTYLNPPK